MAIAFVAFGILFGGVAAGYTLMSGGSILLALAVYSGVGAVGAIVAISALMIIHMINAEANQWRDKTGDGPLSA